MHGFENFSHLICCLFLFHLLQVFSLWHLLLSILHLHLLVLQEAISHDPADFFKVAENVKPGLLDFIREEGFETVLIVKSNRVVSMMNVRKESGLTLYALD